jgi:FUN14 family
LDCSFAGLAYLQYQQIAYFDWDKVDRVVTATFGDVSSQISSNQDISSFAFANIGIPLTSGMSAGFAIGFMKV